MIYRRRASPLHSARAAVGCAYCLALAAAALMLSNPILLGAVVIVVAAAAASAQVARPVLRTALYALPFAVTIAVLNALLTRDGLTVIVRLGYLPLLGHTDVTLEATVYGAMLGLRAVAVLMCGALYTAAVNPDDVLRMVRRLSFRSALTATLATRMVPVLIRDARRLADAQRCRPGRRPSRMSLMRATSAGVLDRALDVAAVLEVRGYGADRRPPRAQRPWSRHDIQFLTAAALILGLAILAGPVGWAPFAAYPSLNVGIGPRVLTLTAGLALIALAPGADRRGVVR